MRRRRHTLLERERLCLIRRFIAEVAALRTPEEGSYGGVAVQSWGDRPGRAIRVSTNVEDQAWGLHHPVHGLVGVNELQTCQVDVPQARRQHFIDSRLTWYGTRSVGAITSA
jgi:hypothetical protein